MHIEHHFCGIYGFKPTDRRVPTTGYIPEVPGAPRGLRQMLTVGGLARSIEDLSLCLNLIAGADPTQPEIPPVSLDRPTRQPLQNRRIAWAEEWSPYPVAAEIKLALRSATTKLTQAGISLKQYAPNFDFPTLWQTYYKLAAYNLIYAQSLTAADIRKNLVFLFREGAQGDRNFRKLGSIPGIGLPISLNPTLKGYFKTLTERDRLITEMDTAFSR